MNLIKEIWNQQSTVQSRLFLAKLKEKLIERYTCDWLNKIVYYIDRFAFYSKIKQERKLETYFTYIDKNIFRDMFVRFRFGVTDIATHKGRYSNIDLSCPLCKNHIENEVHFVIDCPYYDDLRRMLLRLEPDEPGEVSLVNIITSDNVHTLRNFAMYIYYALKRRNNLLDEHTSS